jgi:DNA-binding PadR family transcriptional regulator
MHRDSLQELEHLVLLAIARLDQPTYGLPIVQELQRTIARRVSRASIYVVLRRLEAKGLVATGLGDPTPQRGGRAKRHYTLTPRAIRSLKMAQRDFARLWSGSPLFARGRS